MMGLMLVFVIMQAIYLSRHIQPAPEPVTQDSTNKES
jgi:intracellular septation protein A